MSEVEKEGALRASENPLHVLIVEDSPTDAKLIIHELRRAKRPIVHERVEDAAAMREALLRTRWDVIVSDWSMPRFSALAALDLVKNQLRLAS